MSAGGARGSLVSLAGRPGRRGGGRAAEEQPSKQRSDRSGEPRLACFSVFLSLPKRRVGNRHPPPPSMMSRDETQVMPTVTRTSKATDRPKPNRFHGRYVPRARTRWDIVVNERRTYVANFCYLQLLVPPNRRARITVRAFRSGGVIREARSESLASCCSLHIVRFESFAANGQIARNICLGIVLATREIELCGVMFAGSNRVRQLSVFRRDRVWMWVQHGAMSDLQPPKPSRPSEWQNKYVIRLASYVARKSKRNSDSPSTRNIHRIRKLADIFRTLRHRQTAVGPESGFHRRRVR